VSAIFRFFGRHRKGVGVSRVPPLFSSLVISAVIVCSLFGDYLVPRDPTEMNLAVRLCPPVWIEGGSWDYPLGTDLLGRDILSRIIAGSKISIIVSFLAITLGALIGVMVTMIAAYFGGWLGNVLMRTADSLQPIPIIIIGLILSIVYSPSLLTVIFSMVFILWARYARSLYGEALALMQQDFVSMAKVEGCSAFRIMTRHLFPNLANTIFILATLMVGWAILVEASLSFLGAGIPPPAPSWGRMVSEGRENITQAWWLSTIPGAAILLTVLAFNLFGDWLRDRLDPKLRQI